MEQFNNIKKKITEKVLTSINDIKANPSILILPVSLFIFFSILSYFLFSKQIREFLEKKFVLNREYVNKEVEKKISEKKIKIIYFYTEWCPYCKKSKPEWNSFKELIDLQTFSDRIEFNEVDCDKEPEIANKYKIEGYPTIKLIYNGEIYDYDAKPESKMLLEFVESIINDK